MSDAEGADPALKLTLSEDKKLCSVSVDGHEVELDAAAMDNLIAALGGKRHKMVPEVSRAEVSGEVISVDDPIWKSQPADTGGVGLLLRHPGLGWLSFHLPAKEVKNMGDYLLGRLQHPGGNPTKPVM